MWYGSETVPPTDTASKACYSSLLCMRRLRRRYPSNHFCAFCRMTRSVYMVCGFQKLKPVGFCVLREFCGNYIQRSYKQRNHKYKWGCRLNIIRPLTNHKLYVNNTNNRTPASPITSRIDSLVVSWYIVALDSSPRRRRSSQPINVHYTIETALKFV